MVKTAKQADNGTAQLPAVVPDDIHLPAPAVQRGIEPHVWAALKQLYRGASDEMVLAAVDYCKACEFDPIKRPIHIVKTWDSEQRREVETIWEGIASLRITAARTNEYAGQDEPEFGPEVTATLGDATVTYPEWCKVKVYRLVGGKRQPFTSVVRWKEAYARKKLGAPNAMWQKRPYGQIAKCCEADALRKAFPEQLGGRATAEEMEGQHIGPDNAKDVTPPEGGKLAAFETAVAGNGPETKAGAEAGDPQEPSPPSETTEETEAQPDPFADLPDELPPTWAISTETFPTIADFLGEITRLLSDVCAAPDDTVTLWKANRARIDEVEREKGKGFITAMRKDFRKCRDQLAAGELPI